MSEGAGLLHVSAASPTATLTSSVAPPASHGLHEGTPAPRAWPKESSSGATDHGSVIGPWSLASHSPPGQLVVGSDLITAALKNLYIPTM